MTLIDRQGSHILDTEGRDLDIPMEAEELPEQIRENPELLDMVLENEKQFAARLQKAHAQAIPIHRGCGDLVKLARGVLRDHGVDDPAIEVPINSIAPSPENVKVYQEDGYWTKKSLASSIKKHGLLEPIVITLDNYILSGHRRYAACKKALLRTVKVRYVPMRRSDPEFMKLLIAYNKQRTKDVAEILHERVVQRAPKKAEDMLLRYREEVAKVEADPKARMVVDGEKQRSCISSQRQPFLDAVQRLLSGIPRRFKPLTVRQIHYRLLNDPPLTRAGNKKSRYKNDRSSYAKLSRLLTDARIDGSIDWREINDPTRSLSNPSIICDESVEDHVRQKLDNILSGYQRDLGRSQPNLVMCVCEKNTVKDIVKNVANKFYVPTLVMRGYSSIDAVHDVAVKFWNLEREKLVLLFFTDHDPDGFEMADSLVRSLRDDFLLDEDWIEPIRAALRMDQIDDLYLPTTMEAKVTSAQYDKYVERTGETAAWELETLDPETLEAIAEEAIVSVLDMDLFNAEKDQEMKDAEKLVEYERRIMGVLADEIDRIG